MVRYRCTMAQRPSHKHGALELLALAALSQKVIRHLLLRSGKDL